MRRLSRLASSHASCGFPQREHRTFDSAQELSLRLATHHEGRASPELRAAVRERAYQGCEWARCISKPAQTPRNKPTFSLRERTSRAQPILPSQGGRHAIFSAPTPSTRTHARTRVQALHTHHTPHTAPAQPRTRLAAPHLIDLHRHTAPPPKPQQQQKQQSSLFHLSQHQVHHQHQQ